MHPARRRLSSAYGALLLGPLLGALSGFALGLLAACGEPSAETGGRFEVVQRDLALVRRDAAGGLAPARLGLTWRFARGLGPWVVRRGEASLDASGLQLVGSGTCELSTVAGALAPDGELHHQLRIVLASRGVGQLLLSWRAADEEFSRERSVSLALPDSERVQPLVLRLQSLRSALNAPDAAGGFAALRLRFEAAEPDGALQVRLESIALESDFDPPVAAASPAGDAALAGRAADALLAPPALPAPPARPAPTAPTARPTLPALPALPDGPLPCLPLTRDGLRLLGVALPLQAEVGCRLHVSEGARLRFAAAVAGAGSRVELRVADADGRLPPLMATLASGAPWQWFEVDLTPLSGSDAELRWSVQPSGSAAAAGPAGRVLLGSPLVLAPERVRPALPPAEVGGPPPATRPDVLLYLVDTLRADRLEAYGYAAPTSPVLAQVARQGVCFERVVAASNWTRPAVSTLLTGSGAERHGNQAPGDTVEAELPTLAERFAAAGYFTASFVSNHHAGSWSGLDRGFDLAYEPAAFPRLEPDTSLTSAVIEPLLLAFLAQHRGERLFVYVHTLDPHGPYAPPPQDSAALAGSLRPSPPEGSPEAAALALERGLAYDAEVRHNDRHLGVLLDGWKADGRERQWLLAFTSDHGEAFYEHGQWTHWRTLHEEEIAVPWLLRWPDGLPAGRRVHEVVGQADIAPTLAALCGLDLPPDWSGHDLSALCRAAAGGDEGRGDGRDPVREPLHLARAASRSPPTERLLISEARMLERSKGTAEHLLAARRGDLKLIVRVAEDDALLPVALYDLRSDPHERRDLLTGAAAADPRVDELQEALRRYLATDRARASRRRQPATEGIDAQRLQWLQEMGYLR